MSRWFFNLFVWHMVDNKVQQKLWFERFPMRKSMQVSNWSMICNMQRHLGLLRWGLAHINQNNAGFLFFEKLILLGNIEKVFLVSFTSNINDINIYTYIQILNIYIYIQILYIYIYIYIYSFFFYMRLFSMVCKSLYDKKINKKIKGFYKLSHNCRCFTFINIQFRRLCGLVFFLWWGQSFT